MTVAYETLLEYLEYMQEYLADLDGIKPNEWYIHTVTWRKLDDDSIEFDELRTRKLEEE